MKQIKQLYPWRLNTLLGLPSNYPTMKAFHSITPQIWDFGTGKLYYIKWQRFAPQRIMRGRG